MSGIDWNGILRLPEAALAGCRRIPKTVLVKQAMLTKTEQKRLDKVARLEHFAHGPRSPRRASRRTRTTSVTCRASSSSVAR